MSRKHASIIPVPVDEDDKTTYEVQRWILEMVEALRFEELVKETLPRCGRIMDLVNRERVIQYAVDFLLRCNEFELARSLVRRCPATPCDAEAIAWLCALHLYVAKKTAAVADLDALQQFVRTHEQALGGAEALDLFLIVAKFTRDRADVARVIKYVDSREEDFDLPALLEIVRITQDSVDVERLCERCKRAKDRGMALQVLVLLEILLAEFPNKQAEKLFGLLPTEDARSRSRRRSRIYQLN